MKYFHYVEHEVKEEYTMPLNDEVMEEIKHRMDADGYREMNGDPINFTLNEFALWFGHNLDEEEVDVFNRNVHRETDLFEQVACLYDLIEEYLIEMASAAGNVRTEYINENYSESYINYKED